MAIKFGDDYVTHIEMVLDSYNDLRKLAPEHPLLDNIGLFSDPELYHPHSMGGYIFDLKMAAKNFYPSKFL